MNLPPDFFSDSGHNYKCKAQLESLLSVISVGFGKRFISLFNAKFYWLLVFIGEGHLEPINTICLLREEGRRLTVRKAAPPGGGVFISPLDV